MLVVVLFIAALEGDDMTMVGSGPMLLKIAVEFDIMTYDGPAAPPVSRALLDAAGGLVMGTDVSISRLKDMGSIDDDLDEEAEGWGVGKGAVSMRRGPEGAGAFIKEEGMMAEVRDAILVVSSWPEM